ncbi:fibronectin type III domain-containing protein [Streptomyces sp. TRM66268-LWL]|uniref:Fibronectin type III domain-containing protein n=1 Tax=Streptomyces polyasparticus TaxID=2767826 RepID=A0ABR7SA72_9ACTN|nr:fibronectin type III domain-containing protein [Streptomyces polyasparticus]MBC9712366.1 fibronectin type III domain-containing protein [Streptomyces polyasparticus]
MHRTPTAVLTAAALLLLAGCGGEAEARDDRPPTAPRGLTVHAGSATSVHVMWNKSTDDTAVTRYELFRGGKRIKTLPAATYMVDLTGLTPQQTYTFTVRALDAAGNTSPHSAKVSVTMRPPAPRDTEPPTAPAKLVAKASGARAATLSWAAAKDDQAVTSYDIYQRGSRIHSVDGRTTTALVTGLRPGTDYTFTVRARDAADNSSPDSGSASLKTAAGSGGSEETAPGGFKVETRKDDDAYYLDLSWDAPRTGGDIAEYEIHLNGRQATTLQWGAAAPAGRAKHSFFITREEGQTHRVKIRAKLPDGNWGAFSEERTVTTGG